MKAQGRSHDLTKYGAERWRHTCGRLPIEFCLVFTDCSLSFIVSKAVCYLLMFLPRNVHVIRNHQCKPDITCSHWSRASVSHFGAFVVVSTQMLLRTVVQEFRLTFDLWSTTR